jgi:hypothetical protein
MKILAFIFIAFGLADVGLSWVDIDVWGAIGVTLPDAIWSYSGFIEMAIGYGLLKLWGMGKDKSPTEEE